jgi:hypothetical protein
MKLKTLMGIMIGVAVLGSTLSPSLSFAKENGDKGKNDDNKEKRELRITDRDEKKENKNNNKNNDCRAFGHLIAPGWIKKNGGASSTVSATCTTPRGILNIFWSWTHNDNNNGNNGNGGNGTTTVATTTLPTISDIVTRPRINAAEIVWKTNKPTDSAVFYGTSTSIDVNSSTTPVVERGAFVRNHDIILRNLTASTTYYAIIRSQDNLGNKVYSGTISFMTRGTTTPPVVATTTLPVISNSLAVIGTSTVATSWTTNTPTNSKVFYATSSPVVTTASTTPFVLSGTLITNHALTVTGLATSTLYYMVIQSTDAANNTVSTAQFSFTTGN